MRVADIPNRIRTAFGYDVLNPNGRRKAVSPSVYREDHHVKGTKGRHLQSTAAELARNQSLAAWMVRRHLDYVAHFQFRARSENDELDKTLQRLMEIANLPANADVAGRYTREKLFRLAEMRRVLDGDTGFIKMDDGRMAGVQYDRIRDPLAEGMRDGEEWINGVLTGAAGRPVAFGIYSRTGYSGLKYVRRVNAPSFLFYGFFDRYGVDQVRGVSPLVAALAPLQDVYENFDYALARSKVSQLATLAFFRESSQSITQQTRKTAGWGDDDGDDVESAYHSVSKFDKLPQVFEMDPGDDAKFLESKQPSAEFQNFTNLVIQVALKALDIPYSMYDESHTNFFGSRAAWLHYERSCKDKRDDQIELRRKYTVWQMQRWIRDGDLQLPAGMRIRDVRFEWVPLGAPWWDPAKEIKGHVEAIKAGLDTPQRICRATGTDYYDNIDAINAATDYAVDAGVPVTFAPDAGSADGDGGSGSGDEMALVEAVQKIYLGVGSVVTTDEARQILNSDHGADLEIPAPDQLQPDDDEPDPDDDPFGSDPDPDDPDAELEQ